eukprot:9563581-Alexandrium_andersonii.AAC.1
MSASLVGSEMCIRDRKVTFRHTEVSVSADTGGLGAGAPGCNGGRGAGGCLLYTSDAADDM